MQAKTTYRTTQAIEQDIRRSLAEMEAAADETQAAQAYQNLKSDIGDFLCRSAELREEYFRLKNTVTRQAKDITELELETAIGEAAPGEQQPQHSTIHGADIFTVQNSPDFFFIKLSYGLINIRHIVELDVKAKTLYTANSTRHLGAGDVRSLLYHLKLYAAK